jgi:hypothetical protein
VKYRQRFRRVRITRPTSASPLAVTDETSAGFPIRIPQSEIRISAELRSAQLSARAGCSAASCRRP